MQRIRLPRLLIVGCGDVGLRLLPLLRERFTVYALTSTQDRMPVLRESGAIPIWGNLDQAHTLWRLSQLATHIVHLAPPQKEGLTDIRTRNLLAILAHGARNIRQFIYISTTGVYGNRDGAWIDETSQVMPESSRAKRRVDAEQQVRAWGASFGVRTHILRVPGIYAANRLPTERLLRGQPALNDTEDVYTNHIHADDLARIIQVSVFRGKPQRITNACDDSALKMGAYFDLVSHYLNLPRAPRASMSELSKALDPMTLSFMKESRQISNLRLKELRLVLRYPTVQSALEFISKNPSDSHSD